MDKLLACPFCGGEAFNTGDGVVYCLKCGCQANTIKLWNTRHPSVDRVKEIIEQALQHKIKFIGDESHSYYGTPRELIDDLANSICKGE